MTDTMRAWRVHEYGAYKDKLQLEDVEAPSGDGAASVVGIRAAGVNFPDILAVQGTYQVKAPLPFTPGQEAMGVVEEVADDSPFRAGDRVVTLNMAGAFAERMLALDQQMFPVPDGMADAEAAAFLITYQTAYFALVHRARMQAGETLLVHGGAGGVGTAAIQVGKALGGTVIATAGSAEKLDVCRDCGADQVINYREQDFVPAVKDCTGGRGADVIFDPVGGDVFDKSTKVIAWEGRLVVIGFASGRIPEIAANRILLKNCAIVGLFWGQYMFHDPELVHATHATLCGLWREGKIKPVIYKEYPLDALPQALEDIETRRSYGKIVLVP